MKTGRILFAAIGATAIFGFAATPALALDDDGHQSIFQTFTNLLKAGVGTGVGIPGLTQPDEKPRINYRERAPLVLPPSGNLREPLPPVNARNAAWPKDYDKQRATRATARPAGSVLRDDAGNEILSPRYLRDTGRLARNPARDPVREACDTGDPLAQPCNVPQMWNVLKTKRAGSDNRDLVPGQEPPRTALTDPPAGLRTPNRRAKYTFEPAKDTPVVPDPRESIREEARREREYR